MPADQWTSSQQPVTLTQAGGLVTLVEGSSFSLSDRSGDIYPGGPGGMFVLDTRVVSQWQLLVDGKALQPLSVGIEDPFSAVFVARVADAAEDHATTLLAVRRRWVGSGMREEIELRSYARDPVTASVELLVGSDLADVFDVKAGRVAPGMDGGHLRDDLRVSSVRGGVRRDVQVIECSAAQPGDVTATGLRWTVTLAPGDVWSTCLEVGLSVDGHALPLQYRCGQPAEVSRPTQRLAGWRRHSPRFANSDSRLVRAVARAVEDIGSLVIEDPAHPESPVVAAGAPWFMALFGRDSLLTSYMSLIVDPVLAVGVLKTLARLQGTRVDADTEEQPGRILHEVRFNSTTATDIDDGHIYYGTADATPLFVVLVGELARWGVERGVVDDLLPHVDRALEWIDQYGDRDGDGYVEYERLSSGGLANQGWKDSWDGVSAANGALAEPPIALAEVQGYVYAAYLARAALAAERDDPTTSDRYERKATQLRSAFNRDFWLDDKGWYAIALDGAKRPVDSMASNMGHCLWSGIIEPNRAARVAAHLSSDEMRSGWGLRTLAVPMARYDPLSYHNGSVWPHDTAIAAAGLMRYGFVDEAVGLIEELLDAADLSDGRLPELYAGLSRDDVSVPVAYPSSCSPQAWAAAAPLLMLRTLLRLQPRGDAGRYELSPVAGGPVIGTVDLNVAGSRVTIRPGAGVDVEVSGLPHGLGWDVVPARKETGRAVEN
jgi:glycogen debranching enzyme